jgi:uncharacterized repeat protein (TIGR01451 family)
MHHPTGGNRVDQGSKRETARRQAIGFLISAGLLAAFSLTLLAGASHGAPAPGAADLSVVKTDSPDPVTAGAALTYSIQVRNAGPDPATNVVVTDTLPKGVTFVSANSTQGSCAVSSNKRTVTCKLGTVGVNATPGPGYSPAGPVYLPGGVQITIQVLAPGKAGRITNAAKVTSDLNDPRSGNNSDSATTRVLKATAPKATGPTCRGRRATVVGTVRADLLTGTGGRDVILARAGRDRVFTYGGRDLVCAGRGSDVVRSGARGDKVFGGPGADRLFGGRGGDALRGGGGPDSIRGGRGADLLAGGGGSDRCFGGPGGDVFRSC